MLFCGVQQITGILQPVNILQSDGDLPILSALLLRRFPLNDILVEDMPIVRAHFVAPSDKDINSWARS